MSPEVVQYPCLQLTRYFPFCRSRCVRVFYFDGTSGACNMIMERGLPIVFLFRITVRDGFVLVHIPYPSQVVLMNWRESTSLVVDFQDTHVRATPVSFSYMLSFKCTTSRGRNSVHVLHSSPTITSSRHSTLMHSH